jgi:positive regulator of sigma E activity
MYVPPVAGLILGAGLARWMAGDSAVWALLGSASGGALGLLLAGRLLSRWAPIIRLQRAPEQV